MNKPSQQSVADLIKAEFASRQAVLLQEVSKSITDALKDNQQAIVLMSQRTSEAKSRKWEIAQIVVPAILTGLIGLFVWYTQNRLSNEINANNQAVSTRYALTQEYKKEQFKVYQRAVARLAALESAVAGAEYGTKAKANAIAAKNALDEELTQSEFYFSRDVYAGLEEISFDTSQLQVINPQGSGKPSQLIKKMSLIKKLIRDEAGADIGRLTAQKP